MEWPDMGKEAVGKTGNPESGEVLEGGWKFPGLEAGEWRNSVNIKKLGKSMIKVRKVVGVVLSGSFRFFFSMFKAGRGGLCILGTLCSLSMFLTNPGKREPSTLLLKLADHWQVASPKEVRCWKIMFVMSCSWSILRSVGVCLAQIGPIFFFFFEGGLPPGCAGDPASTNSLVEYVCFCRGRLKKGASSNLSRSTDLVSDPQDNCSFAY